MLKLKRSKQFLVLGILISSIIILVGCAGFQGRVYESKPDGNIGETIEDVSITFVSEDGSLTQSITSDNAGHYKISLFPQRYTVTATHPNYTDYSSAPGFFVVTGDGYQTGNIFMKEKSTNLLLISMSDLIKEPGFEDIVNQYKLVLEETEGLISDYIEIDTDICLEKYGIKVNNPGNWEEVRDILQEIVRIANASYIIILGSTNVVPRPIENVCCNDAGNPVRVSSDAWYIDFNHDQIVDEGLSISRLPDLLNNSSAVIEGLQTAIALHNEEGYTLDGEVRFSSVEYPVPPYGICNYCEEKEAFFNLMSTRDYIFFVGHGSPFTIYSNGLVPIFSIDYINSIDLTSSHPVIIAYFPCSAGVIYPNSSTLSYAFMKAGAAAYVGRTTTQGIPNYVASHFPNDIEGGMPIGPALFQSMRQAVLENGDRSKAAAGHICLYGDPTLRKR